MRGEKKASRSNPFVKADKTGATGVAAGASARAKRRAKHGNGVKCTEKRCSSRSNFICAPLCPSFPTTPRRAACSAYCSSFLFSPPNMRLFILLRVFLGLTQFFGVRWTFGYVTSAQDKKKFSGMQGCANFLSSIACIVSPHTLFYSLC